MRLIEGGGMASAVASMRTEGDIGLRMGTSRIAVVTKPVNK